MSESGTEYDLAGVDGRLDRPAPIPMSDLIVDQPVALVDKDDKGRRLEGDDQLLVLDRHVGYNPPYKHPDDSDRSRHEPRISMEKKEDLQTRYRTNEETRNMLREFTRLARSTPPRYLEFANKWGLLGLCSPHGLPHTHNPEGICVTEYEEPVRFWRRLAKRVATIYRVAARLHVAEDSYSLDLGTPEEWAAIDWEAIDAGRKPERLKPASLVEAKEWIAFYVEEGLEWSDVQPGLIWSAGGPEVRFAGRSNFAYIATQLIWVVAGSSESALCSHCGNIYAPKRKPASARRNYCPECNAEGAKRKLWKRA